MIEQRHIVQLDNGVIHSDVVTIEYNDASGKRITFYCHPDVLYSIIYLGIRKIAMVDTGDTSGLSQDDALLRKRVAQVMRAGVKALLVTIGDKMLTIFMGSEHPRPPRKFEKGFDLVDWYLDIFTKIGISHLMLNDTVLSGELSHIEFTSEGTEIESVFTLHSVTTRPVAQESGSEQ